MNTSHLWICLLFIAGLAINVHTTSLAHTVFLPSDRSLNPFNDRFIRKVFSMNREELHAIMENEENQSVLLQLMHDDDTFNGPLLRHAEVDPYESIVDDKIDDQLLLQDNIDSEWVHLMTAGPLAINYVGHLLVLASKREFSLKHPPTFVFQHITNPNSFRTTIAQVSGSMYAALLSAHTAMDRIQLNVQKVPNHIKTALKLVIAGSPKIIEVLLPSTLRTISKIANESAAHAKTTFDKFYAVQKIIAEIIEANVYTHTIQSDIVEQIQSEINKAKYQQDILNNNINSIANNYEDARREMEKARNEYKNAYNAIPTTRSWFGRLFRKIARAVVSVITAPIRVLGCILGLCYSDRRAFETARQNAIQKANALHEVLKGAERRFTAFAKRQEAEQQNLIAVIEKISKLDLNRISEAEILDILIKSISLMSQIKEQWGRLIQFFSKLSVQADSTQEIVVYEFIGAIRAAQKDNVLITPTDREFFAEILSMTCQEIERGAHLLYVMSKTYYDISSEYMINQITSMSTLLLQSESQRSSYLQSLTLNMTSTSKWIIQLAKERQNEYSLRNKARREEFENFLSKIPDEELEGLLTQIDVE